MNGTLATIEREDLKQQLGLFLYSIHEQMWIGDQFLYVHAGTAITDISEIKQGILYWCSVNGFIFVGDDGNIKRFTTTDRYSEIERSIHDFHESGLSFEQAFDLLML